MPRLCLASIHLSQQRARPFLHVTCAGSMSSYRSCCRGDDLWFSMLPRHMRWHKSAVMHSRWAHVHASGGSGSSDGPNRLLGALRRRPHCCAGRRVCACRGGRLSAQGCVHLHGRNAGDSRHSQGGPVASWACGSCACLSMPVHPRWLLSGPANMLEGCAQQPAHAYLLWTPLAGWYTAEGQLQRAPSVPTTHGAHTCCCRVRPRSLSSS